MKLKAAVIIPQDIQGTCQTVPLKEAIQMARNPTPDKREYYRDYNRRNKEQIAKKKAEYYKKNRDRIVKQNAEYRKKNKERIAEKKAEYYRKNKKRIAEYRRERRLRRKQEGLI